MKRFLCVAMLSGLLISLASGVAMTVGPEVRFHELANVPRTAEPVTFGFPFAKGALVNAERIRVLDEAGRSLPRPVSYTHLTLPTNREV